MWVSITWRGRYSVLQQDTCGFIHVFHYQKNKCEIFPQNTCKSVDKWKFAWYPPNDSAIFPENKR